MKKIKFLSKLSLAIVIILGNIAFASSELQAQKLKDLLKKKKKGKKTEVNTKKAKSKILTFDPSEAPNDKAGISGIYYVGEPNAAYGALEEHAWKRTDDMLKLIYDSEENQITASTKSFSLKGRPHGLARAGVKAGKLYSFQLGQGGPRYLTLVHMIQIEEGIFVVAPHTRSDTKCTQAKRQTIEENKYAKEGYKREFMLGKDKAKMQALIEDKAKYEKLLGEAIIKRCKIIKGLDKDAQDAQDPLAKESIVAPPAETFKEASVTSKVLPLFDAWNAEYLVKRGYKEWRYRKAVKAYIISPEWNIVRNKNTGIITGRWAQYISVFKNKEVCGWQKFKIGQKYNGSSYGQPYVIHDHNSIYKKRCNCP